MRRNANIIRIHIHWDRRARPTTAAKHEYLYMLCIYMYKYIHSDWSEHLFWHFVQHRHVWNAIVIWCEASVGEAVKHVSKTLRNCTLTVIVQGRKASDVWVNCYVYFIDKVCLCYQIHRIKKKMLIHKNLKIIPTNIIYIEVKARWSLLMLTIVRNIFLASLVYVHFAHIALHSLFVQAV